MSAISTDIKFVSPIETDVSFTDALTVDGIPDIPSEYTIHSSIEGRLPKLTLGVDPIEVRVTEVPSTRSHLPADFSIAFSVLGYELLCIRLCGEAQAIVEPYRPNLCEVCAAERAAIEDRPR